MHKQIGLSIKKIIWLSIWMILPSTASAITLISTAPGGDPVNGYQSIRPSFGTGQKILGHIMFKNGVSFSSSGTGCNWDSDGILNGQLQFSTNSATVNLASDLRLGSTATVYNPTSSAATIRFRGGDKKIILGGDFTLPYGMVMVNGAGSLTIDGQDHTLTFSNTQRSSSVFNAPGVNVTLKNMTLKIDSAGVTNFKIYNSSSTSTFTLENVRVQCVNYPGRPAGLAGASSGFVSVKGPVSLECPGGMMALVSGSGSTTVAIDKNSRLKLGKNSTFALAYGNATAASISMVDQTSVLHFDGCTFYTSADLANTLTDVTPLFLTNGTVLFENKVRIINRYYGQPAVNTDMSKGFYLGSGVGNGVNARVLGDAYVIVDGCMAYTP